MTVTYSAPNFKITSNTNVAGLITAKGSGLSTTDVAWACEAATCDLEQNISISRFYVGDNAAGNAVVKEGHFTNSVPGITIQANTASASYGFEGKGANSTFEFGASTVTGAGTQNNGFGSFTIAAAPKIIANGTTFLNLRYMRGARAGNIFRNCTWQDCLYTWLVMNPSDMFMPLVFENCTTNGGTYSFVNNTVNWFYDFGDFFQRWQPKITGDVTAGNNLIQNFNFGTATPGSVYLDLNFRKTRRRYYNELG